LDSIFNNTITSCNAISSTIKKQGNNVRGYCVTYENAGWLRELWYSGLWRRGAYVYPLEFLKGLYDSKGLVTPLIDWEKQRLHCVEVSLAVGNEEVKECAKRILKEHDLEAEENYKPSQLKEIKGKKLRFRGWDKLETFAKLIGFREGERRRRPELLLRLRHLSERKRFEEWTKHYIKVKGRWVERAQKPPRIESQFLTIIYIEIVRK